MRIKIRSSNSCICAQRSKFDKNCPECDGTGRETQIIEIINWKEILVEILTYIVKGFKK